MSNYRYVSVDVDIDEFDDDAIRSEYIDRFGRVGSANHRYDDEDTIKRYVDSLTKPYFKNFITNLLDLSHAATEEDIVNAFRDFIQNRL